MHAAESSSRSQSKSVSRRTGGVWVRAEMDAVARSNCCAVFAAQPPDAGSDD